ncbi:NAD-dependent epimerase/dehydratase family protein [Krasilnikoviella flava]|uniref:Nucleoside-diphosphate-sugar epimerase n=1 Tax=Krasilnikoviella flava TaxID=526729 RepID=A0A1T5LA43_9MICO|nr:NAD-dependent epimerase/dehydratase family protein [Krasilnikoviella flava]SKC72823.1 Nucleoside-diphosphate-sugar epimerase [Krasilnikoviella flava]
MRTVDELERMLATPSAGLVADMGELEGDVLVLGAAGKLGPSLVRLAANAVAEAGSGARVTAVSRFSTPGSAERLQAAGAATLVADLTDEAALADLPDSANVVFLVGAKFGSDGNEAGTWHTNTYLPGRVAERFASSRIVALSTGNVYPLVATDDGGSREGDAPGPVGEYAMSCLGRERVLEAMSRRHSTPVSLIRLNYAVEMRYGVLVDLAQQILAEEPIDITTSHVNLVWQGYANEVTLRALRRADSPPFVLNVTGADTLRVHDLALALGQRLGRDVTFVGSEAPTALLSDASRCHDRYGYPAFDVDELVDLTAHWIADGGEVHGKPTKFQRRDGKF